MVLHCGQLSSAGPAIYNFFSHTVVDNVEANSFVCGQMMDTEEYPIFNYVFDCGTSPLFGSTVTILANTNDGLELSEIEVQISPAIMDRSFLKSIKRIEFAL